MNIITSILKSAIGQAGLVFIVAELFDIVLKRMGKQGVWEDLGNLLAKAGEGLGKAISGFIPGSQVEPVLGTFLKQLGNMSDEFIDALIKELESKKDNSE